MLLYANVPDFASHCTLHAMRRVAREREVPLVDASEVLETRERMLADATERRLGLFPSQAAQPVAKLARRAPLGAVLRVDMASQPGTVPFVTGNHQSLAGFVPNVVALRDDGRNGDERAGDGVWSGAFPFEEPLVLTYLSTNGGVAGSWTGLENYQPRAWALRESDRGRIVHLPVAEFGRRPLRSDPSHPDADGHDAIARALASSVAETRAFRGFRSGAGEPGLPEGSARPISAQP